MVPTQKNRYQYKLEGFDQDWIEAGSRSYVTYTNLNPGAYTLRIKGSNNDDVWNEIGTSLKIKISPPFWQTWWFYFLDVLLLIFFINYLRIRIHQRHEDKRKTEELTYARQLQRSMLPTHNLDLERVEVVGKMETASEVGGDYYDFITLNPSTSDSQAQELYCVAVGDVIGHGVAAGLIVGMIKMCLINVFQMHDDRIPSIKGIISNLNTSLRESTSHERAGLGLCLAVLNPSDLSVEIASTGMLYPYHYDAQNAQLHAIELSGPPLGLLESIDVSATSVILKPGDSLIFLSDGFPERFNHHKEMWGFDATEAQLEQVCGSYAAADEIVDHLFRACDQFANGHESHDDMTIVVIQAKV